MRTEKAEAESPPLVLDPLSPTRRRPSSAGDPAGHRAESISTVQADNSARDRDRPETAPAGLARGQSVRKMAGGGTKRRPERKARGVSAREVESRLDALRADEKMRCGGRWGGRALRTKVDRLGCSPLCRNLLDSPAEISFCIICLLHP